MAEIREYILSDAIHTFDGDITPIPSKVLDAVIDVVILPELCQCLLNVFLSYSNSLGKGLPQVLGLKSCCNSKH